METNGQTGPEQQPGRKAGEPSYAELKAKVAQLEAQITAKLRFSVSEKGGILISGLRRFPIMLYLSEYRVIQGQAKTLEAWIKLHMNELSQSKSE